MLVVQVERFSRVASTVVYLVPFIFLLNIPVPPFGLDEAPTSYLNNVHFF